MKPIPEPIFNVTTYDWVLSGTFSHKEDKHVLSVLLDVFLSSSDDWSVKMWSQLSPKSPLFVFDLQAAVGDISWSIFSSTSFGAATSDGKVFVYDLAVNKYAGTAVLKVKIEQI